ncbi:MAG: hypothetical protein JNJ73_00765 [Hyphomonadaceae bacterium]|nr:hypothetical protein [Hyphomonadaceae bacterium]
MFLRTMPDPPFVFATRFDAWDYLKHLIDLVFAIFGPPAALARRQLLSPYVRADLNFWLRPLERLARILLLAEAADLQLAPLQKRLAPLPGQRRAGGVLPLTDVSQPNEADWRVAFTVLRGTTKPGGGGRGYALPCFNPRPLAARLEALARVALDPKPFALRLAHRLRRGRFGFNPWRRARQEKAVRAVLAPIRTDGAPLMRAPLAALKLATKVESVFDTG